jgi:hypothetical protein
MSARNSASISIRVILCLSAMLGFPLSSWGLGVVPVPASLWPVAEASLGPGAERPPPASVPWS